MANLSPAPKLQFFDANGNLLVGGKLYSYAAGTTTPLATFTDSTGGTSNPNPTILDSRGEANVWLGSSQYKLKLTTSTDVEVWTVDNIGGGVTLNQLAAPGGAALIGNTPAGGIAATTVQAALNELDTEKVSFTALAASGGSALVGFLQAGTGATARTVQSKLRDTVSVKDFGAVGDNVTNDTTAIQNALNSGAKVILFPAGNYVFTTLTIPQRVTLEGEGADVTYLKTATGGNALLLNGERITLKQFTLQQTSGGRLGKGIVGSDKYWLITECVKVLGFDYGLYCDKALYHSHKQSWFEDGNYGVYYWGASGTWNIDWFNNVVTFDTCRFNGNTNIGTYVKGTEIVFINPDWSGMVATNSIGLKVVGETGGQPAHGIKVITPYAEVTDIVFSFENAYVEINGGFVQGGVAAGASAATSIIDADNSTVYWEGRPRDQDYWDFGYRLTNGSRLIFDRAFSGSIRASNTVDGTSAVSSMATLDLVTSDFTTAGTIKSNSTNGVLFAQATTGAAAVALQSNARYWRWFTSNADSTLQLRDETSGLERLRCDAGGNFLLTGGGGLGYGSGSGATTTQTGSRTTSVNINKVCGDIQLFSAAGSASWTSFTVVNTAVQATDNILVSQVSGTDLYQIHVTKVAGSEFRITFATTGGTTVEQPVFRFSVIRGAVT